MMMKKKFKCLSIKQKESTFYCITASASFLKNVCSTSMKEINSGRDVFQRSLSRLRTMRIADFINRRSGGLMPPAIILNSRKPLVFEGDDIIIDENSDQFFIIDGQHRLAGAFESEQKDYEFCVIIFDYLDNDLQSELFVSINSEQRKVNPNVRFRIKASSGVLNPEQVVTNIAFILNDTPRSPLFGMIKLDDSPSAGQGVTISLSSFSEILLTYFYNPDDYFELKDFLKNNGCEKSISGSLYHYKASYDKCIFWKFYIADRWDITAKILWNYFSAIKEVFPFSWGHQGFTITKTTGINALMLLLKDVYNYCEQKDRDFRVATLCTLLHKLKTLDGNVTLENFGLGKAAVYSLYREMYQLVFDSSPSFDYSILDRIDEEYDSSLFFPNEYRF